MNLWETNKTEKKKIKYKPRNQNLGLLGIKTKFKKQSKT